MTSDASSQDHGHSIGFLLFPGFQVMSLSLATVFELANLQLGHPRYQVTFLSENGGGVASSIGATVETEAISEQMFDTLMVGASTGIPLASPALRDYLCAAHARARRIAATCTGAFLLAQAGILEGRRATTHWFFAQRMREDYPRIKVEEDRIFILDGSVWTSAGMTAGLDLALAMVEKDLGREVARAVARKLVIYHRRAGGQSQFSALLELEPKSDRIQKALDYAKRNLHAPLPVEKLAEVVALSPRQFTRAFTAETGESPARAVERLRVETARLLLEQGRLSLDVIAQESGFPTRQRMRRAFLRTMGHPPQELRRHYRAAQ